MGLATELIKVFSPKSGLLCLLFLWRILLRTVVGSLIYEVGLETIQVVVAVVSFMRVVIGVIIIIIRSILTTSILIVI